MKNKLILTVMALVAVAAQAIEIKSGPYLQNVTDSEATFIWRTDKPATAWVEMAPDDGTDFYACQRPRFYSTKVGRAVIDTLHTVTVKNLQPDTRYRYRVYSEEVKDMVPWHINYGGIAASDVYNRKPLTFSTLNPGGESINFKVVNDIHGDKETLSALLKGVNNENTDFVVFNGDMVNWMTSEDQLFNDFLNRSARTFAGEVPLFMARGNHETRGAINTDYMKYFPTSTSEPYYCFSDGPVFVMVLDSGEDKPDSDIEYSRTAFYDDFRTAEAQWLEKVVESKEFKEAPYKIAIIHMPPLYIDWHGLIDAKNKFLPLLNRAGIDLMLAGHFHQFSYTDANKSDANFPIIVNSNKDVVEVAADADKIQVDIRDREGKIIHSYTYPAK